MAKFFLNSAQRESLRQQHRLEKDGRTRDRIKAVLLHDKGWSFKAIAEVLLLDDETVASHVHEYIEKRKLKINSGGSDSKLDESKTVELIAHLEQNTYEKVAEICSFVETVYDVSYSVAGMTSWLKNNGFTYKKPKCTPAKADPIKQEEFIKYYNDLMNNTLIDEPILFGDGVHPTMATKITKGWIKKGEDKPILTTGSKGRMNLMGSLNLENMSIIVEEYETIDSAAMEEYFKKLKEAYPNAPKIHMILDQGPYNKSKDTLESAKKHGIVLHFLPPYSPNLNPIERLWKVMNEHVRNNKFFKNIKEFKGEISNFFTVTWGKIAPLMIDRINDNFERVAPG